MNDGIWISFIGIYFFGTFPRGLIPGDCRPLIGRPAWGLFPAGFLCLGLKRGAGGSGSSPTKRPVGRPGELLGENGSLLLCRAGSHAPCTMGSSAAFTPSSAAASKPVSKPPAAPPNPTPPISAGPAPTAPASAAAPSVAASAWRYYR